MSRLFYQTLLAALGIHGILLTLPLSTPQKSSTQEPGQVRIARLSSTKPASTRPLSIPPQQRSQSLPVSPPQAKPLIPPRVSPPQSGQPPIAKPSSLPLKRTGHHSPAASPPGPNSRLNDPAVHANDLVVDLARLPGTQPCDSGKGCWKSGDSQWRSVYASVQKQLSEQGYELTELDQEDDTGFKVSRVSKNGTARYYLHLLSTLQGTIYVLDAIPLSRTQLEEKVKVKDELTG